jgi:hypothetical protein
MASFSLSPTPGKRKAEGRARREMLASDLQKENAEGPAGVW